MHPRPVQPQAGGQRGNRHHHDGNSGSVYYVPYYVPYYPMDYEGSVADEAPPQDVSDSYEGGPTIFDRRGSGERAANDYVDDRPRAATRPPTPAAAPRDSDKASPATAARAAEAPVSAPEPVIALQPTILIFKDGHKQQIGNYAIVGANLYDLTPGRRQKVPIADLDVVATQKANDDEGNDFKLPQFPGN
jgi:hypothetical protein